MAAGGGRGGGSGTGDNPSGIQRGGGGRLCEAMGGVPLVTLVLLVVNVTVFVAQYVGDFGVFLSTAAISPVLVLYYQQWWRIVTAAFTHGGLMHIGMNMLTLYQLGMGVETLFGSLAHIFIILVFMVATGVLYVVMAWLASWVYPAALYSSAVGFSGVLFAMAVDEASLSPFPTRSVFGLFSVPTRVYPWVLMLLIQFIMPNVSLMGHLAGALVGFIHTWGGFQWLLPSLPALRRLEAAPCMARIVRTRPYKLLPATEVLREASSFRTQMRAVGSALACLCAPLLHLARGLWSTVRGRGGASAGAAADADAPPPAPAPASSTATAPRAPPPQQATGDLPDVPSAVDDEAAAAPRTMTDTERRDRAALLAAAARARLAAAAAGGRGSLPSPPVSGGAASPATAPGDAQSPPPVTTPAATAPPPPATSIADRLLGPGARGYRAVPGTDAAPST